jgi:hypothetical protein
VEVSQQLVLMAPDDMHVTVVDRLLQFSVAHLQHLL